MISQMESKQYPLVFPFSGISSGGFFIIIFFLMCSLLIPFSPFTTCDERLFINHLIEDMDIFDRSEIEISGEVVGDIMKRGKGIWVNVDDGSECISVWTPETLLPRIDFVGNYGSKGDTLLIKGVFNRACPLHGGDTDIHALEINRIQIGHAIAHPISQKKIEWTLVLIVLTIVTAGAYYWKNHRSG